MQYLITRNIISNSAISEIIRYVLNFSISGFLSGVIYAVMFKRGFLPFAAIPVISIGVPLLIVAMVRGEVGGVEAKTFNAWEFAIPVFLGICFAYIGAIVVRRIR